jgi:hypothetical protein
MGGHCETACPSARPVRKNDLTAMPDYFEKLLSTLFGQCEGNRGIPVIPNHAFAMLTALPIRDILIPGKWCDQNSRYRCGSSSACWFSG